MKSFSLPRGQDELDYISPFPKFLYLSVTLKMLCTIPKENRNLPFLKAGNTNLV